MTYEWAKPGVKVVCVSTWVNIGPAATNVFKYDRGPIEGQVYTIREIGELHPSYPGDIQVRLHEIFNKPQQIFEDPNWETCFNIKRFRPLIDKRLPDSLTILLEKPNRLIVPSGDSYDRRDGGKWDVRKTREKEKSR